MGQLKAEKYLQKLVNKIADFYGDNYLTVSVIIVILALIIVKFK